VLRAPQYTAHVHRGIRLPYDWLARERPVGRGATRPLWYAGIDWADDQHDVVIIDEPGQRVASCRVAHTPEGFAELTTFLHQTLGAAPASQELACRLETTPGLLITALLDAGWAV
jgi:hypothetical protein